MTSLYNSSSTTVRHSLAPQIKELIGNQGCISLFWKIIKIEDTGNTPKIIYQINLGSRSSVATPKPICSLVNAKSWGKSYPKDKKHDGITWVTIESSIEKFIKFVESGFAYRLGVKERGNDLKNYIGSNGIAFDLDNNPEVSLEETIAKIKELELYGIIHYSPSGNSINNKFRLILFFNEFVTDYSRVNHLTRCLGSLLPNNANNVHDPARFFYGSILPIPHIETKTNDFKFLYAKYSGLLEKIEKAPIVSVEDLSIDDEGLTVPQKFGIKFSEWLKQSNECLGNFITKICENFDLPLDNWHEHDSPGDNLEQWRGLDPIHPEDSKTGSSFTVYHAPNGTYGYKADRVGAAGDLIDLWYRLKHHAWDVDGGVRSRINKSAYWECLREICIFLNVSDWTEEFSTKKEEKLSEIESKKENTAVQTTNVQQALEEKTQIKTERDKLILTWKDCYILKKESVSLNPTNCGLYFSQVHENCFYYDTIFDCFWLKTNGIWKRKNEKDFNGYLIDFILKQENLYDKHIELLMTTSFKSQLTGWFKFLSSEYLKQNVEPSWNHIPCKNGVFDIENKKLLSYEENTSFVTHKLPYSRKKVTGRGINALRLFLEEFLVDKRAIDDFILWTAGVVQNKGWKTRQAVSLVGDSGSGKSTLCDLVKNLVAPDGIEYQTEIVKYLDATKIFSDEGNFNLQPLEHQRLVILSEFTGFSKSSTQGSNIFKNLVAGEGEGHKVTTPLKHSNQDRNFLFRGAFITNSQDYTKFKAEDMGINRRLMVLKVHKITDIRNDIFDPLKDHEIIEDLWNYFLDFDLKEDVYPRMAELSSSDCKVDWKIDSTTLMNQANNKVWSFAMECLDITLPEDLNDKTVIPQTPAKMVYDTFVRWCESQGERNPGTQTSFGIALTKAVSHFTKMGTDDIKKRLSRGVVYQYVQIKTDLG